ncbi:hypothetical protein M422DRAFT_275208 [Sphaerobolus stellatus SS14]|uniref:Uncharacterized protein n=1 Tax=Sphaerobolus stellatus (strain SS14) TaxID=990650 RepID=A0A0C9T5D8_SPHS4|nr:hypothetical protein M422DRAFT_275208 [Sphaerobolus stellatus SS14]
MKYNDHGKLLFDTELQQHLDAMILCMYKNVTEQFSACASDGHSHPPTILSLSQKTGSTAKTFPLTANHVIDGKTYEQGDPSSQSDASTGVQPHNIFLPGDKSVRRTTLDDTSAFEQQRISGKKFNSYSRADLQESNGSLHNFTLQDSVSTMDPTAAASFEECGTNSHVAPMMPNNRGSGGVMPGAVTSSHKGLKRTLSQSSIESLGSSNTHPRQHNTYESNSDDQPDMGSQCSTISSRKRPKRSHLSEPRGPSNEQPLADMAQNQMLMQSVSTPDSSTLQIPREEDEQDLAAENDVTFFDSFDGAMWSTSYNPNPPSSAINHLHDGDMVSTKEGSVQGNVVSTDSPGLQPGASIPPKTLPIPSLPRRTQNKVTSYRYTLPPELPQSQWSKDIPLRRDLTHQSRYSHARYGPSTSQMNTDV